MNDTEESQKGCEGWPRIVKPVGVSGDGISLRGRAAEELGGGGLGELNPATDGIEAVVKRLRLSGLPLRVSSASMRVVVAVSSRGFV